MKTKSTRKKPPQRKSLGQIAYDATLEGGKQNWGEWHEAPGVVRRVHNDMAAAVEKAVLRRQPTIPPTLVALEKAAVEYAKLRPWDESNPLAAAATKHARHLAARP